MLPAMTDRLQPSADSTPRFYTLYVAFVAAIGGFLFGYDLVIISGAQIFLRQQFALTPEQLGFATSSALFGCIGGPFFGAWICDAFGRKAALLTAALLFITGAVGTALARDITIFNVFRILGGVGIGFASLASPLYIAEIAPAPSRGRLGLMYQLAITIGAVMATIVSYVLARTLSPDLAWRWMFASVIVPVVIFCFLLIPVPPSPRWLAERQRSDEALAVLTRISGAEQARRELAEIEGSLHQETGTIRELFEPGMRAALGIGLVLAVLGNWTGWTAMSLYMPTLFQEAGFVKPSDAIAQNVLVMGATVLLTLVSISLVDRAGRRPLWVGCSAAMCVCLILAGIVFHLHLTGSIVVVAIFLCAAPHAIGLGPLPWLMMSEIYPTRIRAKAVSLCTTMLWIAGFSAPFAFPLMESLSLRMVHSVAGVFWFYSLVCVFSLVWGYKFLPETRGRTLENVADSWKVRETANILK
jgi:SP family arabinose:H+ symporter-like MFS transporter